MLFHISSSSPYTHKGAFSTSRMMILVLIAALPGILAQIHFFSVGFLIQIIIALFSALSTECIILYLRNMEILPVLSDNSAVLTAVFIAISIPPLSPWWLVVLGTIFAIVIAKHVYGGLGHNPFNPAMVGYVMLLISFPIQMTSWLPATRFQVVKLGIIDTTSIIFSGHTTAGDIMQNLHMGIDGITQATPLDDFKTSLSVGSKTNEVLSHSIYQGIVAGVGWEWVNFGYLLGGVFLLFKKIIRWHIPISFLTSLGCCSTFGWLFIPNTCSSPIVHFFSGATMLCAFFISTDPVTASTTNFGRLIYGTMIGILVWLIRSFGGYPDGVAFAVLLANMCVPLLDYYTRPRVYGHK